MSDYWKEVEATPTPASSAAVGEFLVPTNARLALRAKTAATWTWAFAGFSVVNVVLAYVGAPIAMVVSLFLSDVCFAIGLRAGSFWVPISLILCTAAVAGMVILGFLMLWHLRWAFVVGIAVLAVDALALYKWTTLAGVWPFLLHGLAIYYLWVGFKAAKFLLQRRKNGQA